VSRELKAGDIASRNGISRRTASRWLKAIHEDPRYGSRVVARRGNPGVYVTTEDAFAIVAALVAGHSKDARRIADVEERIADQETRMDQMARELGELRRQSARSPARAIR
jgi:CRP-like cAMP-binding protein